jgi:hypothetical protein
MGLQDLIHPVAVGCTIGINESNDPPSCHGDTPIACIAAEFPFRKSVQSNFWKPLFNKLGCTVGRTVNNDDLKALVCFLIL